MLCKEYALKGELLLKRLMSIIIVSSSLAQYGVLEGATARVISVLSALKRFISDYRTPEACDLSRDMADKLKPNVDFLAACRPHAIAMDNAIRCVRALEWEMVSR